MLITFFNPTKVNFRANRWFALFFLSAGFMMITAVVFQYNVENKYHFVLVFTELSRLIATPTLYFVVLNYTSPNRVFKLTDYLHFLPFVLLFVFTILLSSRTGDDLLHYREWLPLGLFYLLIIQMCYYLTSSIIVLYQHQKNIKLINADVIGIDLTWLKNLLYIVSFMLALLYANIFFNFQWVEHYRPIVFLAGVLYLGYQVIAQKEIYPFEILELQAIDQLITGKEQLNSPRLTAVTMADYKARLIKILEIERPYLQNNLTLLQLAGMMEISSHDLSYVLNKGFNMTFFKFINSYRIAEAKKLLLSEDHTHFNILGIAYNSGFNSKSTFNSTFKKETGLSPSEFINTAKPGTINCITSKI